MVLASAALSAVPSTVDACCLTDWLYGRSPTYAAAASAPYTVGYAPATTVLPLPGSTTVSSGYTPLLGTGGVTAARPALPLAGQSIYSPAPAYSLQRPAYGAVPLDNPSVYTGRPVVSNYRGLATTSNPYYGTGNIYPSTGLPPVAAMRPALAPTAAVTPQPSFATPIRTGLSRFFSSLLGTGYRSAYYTAPVTYYRPATAIDPLSGTTVTMQQPCTSTVQQLQRTPFSTLMPAGGATVAQPGCSTLPIPSSYGGYAPSSLGGVAPSMGSASMGDLQPLSPPSLPSTTVSPSASFYPSDSNVLSAPSTSHPQSNLAPLTGEIRSPSDVAPMAAPQLESARPAYGATSDWDDQGRASQQVDPSTEYQPYDAGGMQPSADPLDPSRSSLDDPTTSDHNDTSMRWNPNYQSSRYQESNSRVSRPSAAWHDVRPIPAPAEYGNPFDRDRDLVEPRQSPMPFDEDRGLGPSARTDRLTAPDFLPTLPTPNPYQRAAEPASRSHGAPLSVPVREASIRGPADRLASDSSRRELSSSHSQRTWQRVNQVLKPSVSSAEDYSARRHTESGWYTKP
ncbi:MAG: hypothetical protein AAF670_08985 [Planctomycetota bacterium]